MTHSNSTDGKRCFLVQSVDMKVIITILALCFTLITASIAYLLHSGVSIRTAPIIKPSIITSDFHNVPQGLFVRLFPDFQQADYILWGVSQNSREVQTTLSMVKSQYEREFTTPVNFIYDGTTASTKDIESCPRPCWILFPESSAHELSPNTWINEKLRPLNKTYFTINWIPFKKGVRVPEYCTKEKRLDLECLKVVSVNEVTSKMKAPDQRYFFVRKYLDSDYFIFIEDPLNL